MHPTTRMVRLFNQISLYTFARALDNYAMSRTISGRGMYVMRHFGIARGFFMVAVGSAFIVPFLSADIVRLEYAKQALQYG